MRTSAKSRAFTLLELLVAVSLTLALAAVLFAVALGALNLWRRTQDGFTMETQAKLALDLLERDLQAGVFRSGGADTWLAADVENTDGTLPGHGWFLSSTMKPASPESLRLVPATGIGDARFGLSGLWLRFITTNVETAGSLPAAVAYQIVRRPASGAYGPANPGEPRYTLCRSAVDAARTFSAGNTVTSAAYAHPEAGYGRTAYPESLASPAVADALAANVVDFGVWLHVREPDGTLRRIFPADAGDLTHAVRDDGAAPDGSRYPGVADVMLRIMTDEGARRLAAIEAGGVISRPAGFPNDAAWWWSVVEANSRVYTRRIELKGAAP